MLAQEAGGQEELRLSFADLGLLRVNQIEKFFQFSRERLRAVCASVEKPMILLTKP
jgi:hypothetical protein